MNINTFEIYNKNTINIQKASSDYADVQLKLSAGRKVINPSDNPAETVQALCCSHELAAMKQYDISRNNINNALTTQEVVSADLNSVVRTLNRLGASPGDLMAILQSMKSAGCLRARLEME